MAKARSTRTKTATRTATRTSASRRIKQSKWVRKNVVMDQRKLDAVRRLYDAATEKEAIDMALDSILASRDMLKGIAAIREMGGIDTIDEVFKRR